MSTIDFISIIENNIENIDEFRQNIEIIFEKYLTIRCSDSTLTHLKSENNFNKKKRFLDVDILNLKEDYLNYVKKYDFFNKVEINTLIKNYRDNGYLKIDNYFSFEKFLFNTCFIEVSKDNSLSFLTLKGNRTVIRFHTYQLAKLFKSKKAIYICEESDYLLGDNIDDSFSILDKLGFKQYPINQFWEETYAEGYDEARDKGYFVDTFNENFENEFLNYTLVENDIVFDENGIGFS